MVTGEKCLVTTRKKHTHPNPVTDVWLQFCNQTWCNQLIKNGSSVTCLLFCLLFCHQKKCHRLIKNGLIYRIFSPPDEKASVFFHLSRPKKRRYTEKKHSTRCIFTDAFSKKGIFPVRKADFSRDENKKNVIFMCLPK